MSSHNTSSPMRRRSVLQLLLSSGLGLGMAACGGGSDESEHDKTTAVLKTQADAAIASGLVGLALGQVSSRSNSVRGRPPVRRMRVFSCSTG